MHWSLEVSATHLRGGLDTSSNLSTAHHNEGCNEAEGRPQNLQCNVNYHYHNYYYDHPQFHEPP